MTVGDGMVSTFDVRRSTFLGQSISGLVAPAPVLVVHAIIVHLKTVEEFKDFFK